MTAPSKAKHRRGRRQRWRRRPTVPTAGVARETADLAAWQLPSTVVMSLGFEPEAFTARVELVRSPRMASEDVAALYWAVQALDPVNVDLTDDVLTACVQEFGPNAQVVAWRLVDEFGALPQAVIGRVEVSRAGSTVPELVLTADSEMPDQARRVAA